MAPGVFRRLAMAATLALVAAPAAAQFSDGYQFLKAVRDRDGTEATKYLNEPGSVVVNTRDLTSGETGLMVVVQRRDTLWTRFLLDHGADPNIGNKAGQTPLTIAAGLGYIDGAELLIKAGARIDVPNEAGETPLIAAVHRRDAAMVRLLLKSGADADRSDNSGRTARDYAKLMGGGMLGEIERAEQERSGSSGNQQTYGPGL